VSTELFWILIVGSILAEIAQIGIIAWFVYKRIGDRAKIEALEDEIDRLHNVEYTPTREDWRSAVL
jgi:purine-cytosine permease-like protein